jgi:predicted GIY-YIG superfamily endonuclease
MDARFEIVVSQLHDSYEKLIQYSPIHSANFPRSLMSSGVYLFSEGTKHLYVGRTNNIRGRYGRHCNPGATHRMAAFAFRLAREKTGKLKASYKAGEESRKGLMGNNEFALAFSEQKARIRAMDFRWVEEADPVRQCLLEVYCAVVLQTPYNDFDNH